MPERRPKLILQLEVFLHSLCCIMAMWPMKFKKLVPCMAMSVPWPRAVELLGTAPIREP